MKGRHVRYASESFKLKNKCIIYDVAGESGMWVYVVSQQEGNCCNLLDIYEWNYEIIRWTVKLINMMTYFITSQNSRYYANILMCKLPPPNEANAILQSNILILPRCFSLPLWESLASCQITYVFIFPIASSSLYSSMIYSKCNGIKKIMIKLFLIPEKVSCKHFS